MAGRLSFIEKAERTLIIAMILGIVVIAASPRILWMYQAGLGLLITATLLQIAVGNVPKDATVKRSLKLIAIILSVVLCVFLVGIGLVPILSQLGR